jgi:aspartyl-tRNA(Asn)/glutamyl-tRNA(Gln) amidotransferase subunit C
MAQVVVDIKHIAKLANLQPTPAQLQRLHIQLPSILQYVTKVQQLKTNQVTETSQVTGLTNIVRQDRIDPGRMLSQTEALSNAPATHNGYFVVKSIF